MLEPLAPHELQRLQALARYAVLDTMPEQAFDRLTRLAARLFSVPTALVTLVDEERQWFKACFGLDLCETPRSQSFCAHAIREPGVMVVPDAHQDPRFADNPLVTGHPRIRFYAGAPLITRDGYKLGSLCIIDNRPRPGLTDEEQLLLVDLAALVMDELEWRLDRLRLETESRAKTQILADLHRTGQEARILVALADLAEYNLSLADYVNAVGGLLRPDLGVQWVQVSAPGQPTAGTAWSGPQVPAEFLRLLGELNARSGPASAPPGVRTEAPLFAGGAGGHFAANPAFGAVGLGGGAWLPFTTSNGTRYVLAFARFGDPGPWQPGDRTLLQAAAHALNLILSREEHRGGLEAPFRTVVPPGFGDRRELERDLAARVSADEPLLLAKLDLGGFRATTGAEQDTDDESLLRLFGEALRAGTGRENAPYWLSEQRLALLLPSAAPGEQQGERVTEHVNRAVAAVRAVGFEPVGVNAGVALYPQEAREVAGLLALARTRLDGQAPGAGSGTVKAGDRAPAAALPAPLSYGPLLLQPEQRRVWVGEQTVRLSRQETRLLALLMGQPEAVCSRASLVDAALGTVTDGSNLVNVHLSHLRRKLRCVTGSVGIRTVRGEGYALTRTAGR